MSIDATVKLLEDTRQIVNALNLYGLAIDTLRFELFDEVFQPDFIGDYQKPSYFNNREEIRRTMADFHEPLDGSQHTITNHQVLVDGDRATTICYVTVRLFQDDRFFQQGGFYSDEFVRTPAGWRIQKRFYRGNWWEGTANIGGDPHFDQGFVPQNQTLRRSSDLDVVPYLKALRARP